MVLNNIGVTGATGLVGSHLISKLLKNNFKVIAISRKKIKSKKNITFKKFNFKKKGNFKSLDKIFKKVDYLIHLASILPNNSENFNNKRTRKVNIYFTKLLAKWALRKKIFFIFFSTASIYKANTKKKKKEESKVASIPAGGKYALQKYVCEKYLYKLKKKGLKLLIIRPTSIYGYGQNEKTFLARHLNKLRSNKDIIFFKPLSMKLNFIHATDVSNAIIYLIRKNIQGIYNLAHEKNISIKRIIDFLKKLFPKKRNKIIICDKNKKNLSNFLNIDISKIKKTGWKNKIDILKGLRLMLEKKFY